MALRDYATELSRKQTLVGAGTKNSSNVYDTGITGGDAAVGEDFAFLFEIDTAVNAGTSVDFQLQTSDDEAFGSGTTVYASGAIPVASLVKGFQKFAKAPLGLKRYVRAQYVVVGATDAGAVTTGIVKDYDATRAFPSGWKL